VSLAPPPKVEQLQKTLHAKAKGSPDYRFYALYDKVYRKDVLEWAYARCRANGGAAGVDRQTFEDIEAYGLDGWLDELAADLRARTSRPRPVRRVFIPKPDGKRRPLGIGPIRAWRKRFDSTFAAPAQPANPHASSTANHLVMACTIPASVRGFEMIRRESIILPRSASR